MKRPALATLLLAAILAGCGTAAAPPTPTPTTAPDPAVARGRDLFGKPPASCATCHSLTAGTVIVGPSLAGIASRAAAQQPGVGAREYIERSILKPGEHVVEGFPDAMPTDFGKKLTSDQFNDLVAFLLTQE